MDLNNSDNFNAENDDEEQRNFLSVIAAFKYYRKFSLNRVNSTEKYLNTLPDKHQEMLTKYRQHLNRIRDCVEENNRVIKHIIKDAGAIFQNQSQISPKADDEILTRIKPHDLERVQVTLKQFTRDWSSDGEVERNQCYKPIIDEIQKYYNPDEIDISDIKILVPGAGLGRLSYELAYRGYYCEGNEFSLFMLIASNFVLNQCLTENQYRVFPYIHQFVNNLTRADQITPISFPDVSPTQNPPKGVFNMVAGDFLQVYLEADFWNCVATCFFIDCANNVVEFIENIFKILKPGGIWVNLGPLLYHYSDIPHEGSIEPTYEDLIPIIKTVGFEFLKNETGVKTKYAQNPKSMLQNEYSSVFFVCRKPDEN